MYRVMVPSWTGLIQINDKQYTTLSLVSFMDDAKDALKGRPGALIADLSYRPVFDPSQHEVKA